MRTKLTNLFPILLTVVGSTALMGCEGDPKIEPATAAPPGAVADYFEDKDTDKRTIRLTEGLAFALECSDPKGRPCTWEDSATEDPAIATGRRAYGDLDQKLVHGSTVGQSAYRTRMLFVVTGHKPGSTTLNLKTGMSPVSIKIEVLPAGK